MTKPIGFIFLSFISIQLSAIEYHVSVKGNDLHSGSEKQPLKTISAAVAKAFPGDTVTVHNGTYREWVNPLRGGNDNNSRIVYRVAPGEKAELKGSERIVTWKKEKNGLWKVVLPNSFFGDYNPYADKITGDWFNACGKVHHTGEVYLNGNSFYEVASPEEVLNPTPIVSKAHPNGSSSVWCCEVTDGTTTITANFGKVNPNKELTEINVRKTCFYPDKPGINYITLNGFQISQAATQWAAPTAEQIGMVATHWNKGWIIENNTISDSKCSGITLGKERATGHNVWLNDQSKDGSLHYIEVVFRTLRNGWDKENIGSHIVRNNRIFHCEQTGICGSMGAAFSEIYGNLIHDNWVKRRFNGAEIAGIKFHGAIDTYIYNNCIRNSGKGIWLDWMTQGTRVSGNLLFNNDEMDLFLEVNHGPFLIDNNIMLSPLCILEQSEGGAFVHNLIAGEVRGWSEPNRFTPYHLPHSTEIAGLATIVNGDHRYYNNIFTGIPDKKNCGLAVYNEARQPIYTGGNIYYNNASPLKNEKDAIVDNSFNPNIKLNENDGRIDIALNLCNKQLPSKTTLITTELLGKTKMAICGFENMDGNPIVINKDFLGNKRPVQNPQPGPFEIVTDSYTTLKVW